MTREDPVEHLDHVWKATAGERLRVFLSARTRYNTSWYFAIILLTWVLSTAVSQDYQTWEKLAIGLIGGLLFFVSMVVAQTIVDFVMVYQGMPLRNVVLFVFGGQTAVPANVTRPSLEVYTAATQFGVAVLMAALFNWIYALRSNAPGSQPTVLQLLSFVWYMLAIFHLLPAYPLAGGRAVAAAIWKGTGSRLRGITLTSFSGQLLGLAMLGIGLWLLVARREATGGLMLAFLGWALQSSARVSVRRLTVLEALRDARVGNVMSPEFHPVSPGATLEQIVREHVLVSGEDYLPVAEGGRFLGVITSRRIKKVRRRRWPTTAVAMVMLPAHRVTPMKTTEMADHVYERMEQFRVNTLPVLNTDGTPAGVITRDRLVRLARARQVLKI